MSKLDDSLFSVETPENVAFGYEVAGIGSRFLAALIDTIFIAILQIITNFVIFFIIRNFLLQLENEQLAAWGVAIFGLISFGLLWGYYTFFEILWHGQSPGKRLIHLRVLQSDGSPVTLTESLIRNLVRLVDFLPLYYGIGVFTMFFSKQARRLGDLAAGTLVVYSQNSISLDSLRSPISNFPVKVELAEQVSQLPVERLGNEELQLGESFLGRRPKLENGNALSKKILESLFIKMEVPLETYHRQNAAELIKAIILHSQTDGESTNKRISEWANKRIDERVNEHNDGLAKKKIDEPEKKQIDKSTNEQIDKPENKKTNEAENPNNPFAGLF